MYSFAIPKEIFFSADYDRMFGKGYGEAFADVMEECYYFNPLQSTNLSGYVSPLENVMSLPQFMAAILATYIKSINPHAKSSLAAFFKYNEFCRSHVTIIEEKIDDNNYCYVYQNIAPVTLHAILFGAYFYAKLREDVEQTDNKVSNFLMDFLLQLARLSPKDFKRGHVAAKLYEKYYEPTLQKVHTSLKRIEEEKAPNVKEDNADVVISADNNPQVIQTLQQTIDNLQRQNEQLKARVADLEEALKPKSINEAYRKEIEYVFQPTYPVERQPVGTYRAIQQICPKCINPADAPSLAVFIQACINVGCVRDCALSSAQNIVGAFIGLGLLPEMNEDEKKKFRTNLGKKFARMADTGLSDGEAEACRRICERLRHPYILEDE